MLKIEQLLIIIKIVFCKQLKIKDSISVRIGQEKVVEIGIQTQFS